MFGKKEVPKKKSVVEKMQSFFSNLTKKGSREHPESEGEATQNLFLTLYFLGYWSILAAVHILVIGGYLIYVKWFKKKNAVSCLKKSKKRSSKKKAKKSKKEEVLIIED